MDGETFVSNLQQLPIPGSELLNANDFDWIFLDECNQLSLFWKWFFIHINSEDVLSDEDIQKYDELVSSGSVFSENYLKLLENCSESVSIAEDIPQINITLDETLEEDVLESEKYLKRLKEKMNLLSLQKMEAEAQLNKKRKYLQRLQSKMEREKRPVQRVCSNYSRAAEEVSTSIQSTTSPFLSFLSSASEAKFLLQISNSNWSAYEMDFREAVFQYNHKQFQEGMDSFVGQNDESQCRLLDSTQLDMQFVRGPRQGEYLRNVNDLRRINQMLEETELAVVDYSLKKAQNDSEMKEAIKFRKILGSKTFNSLPFIKENVSCLKETQEALEQDLTFQKDHLKKLGLLVSKTEGLRVVSGNYEIKLKRQEYFLSKHHIVFEFLVGQLSRLDLMKIMYDIEHKKISTIFSILGNLNKTLREDFQASTKRLKELDDRLDIFKQDVSVFQERKTFLALLEDFEKGEYRERSDRNLVQIAENLDSSLKTLENEIKLIMDGRMNNINRLFQSCLLLEESLFGTSNSISNLPESWVNCKILDDQAKLEQAMWALQKEMFQILKSYEKKKKIIEDTPSLHENFLKWTKANCFLQL